MGFRAFLAGLISSFCVASTVAATEAELHWNLCGHSSPQIMRALGGQVGKAKRRIVYYLDTDKRHYLDDGILFRVRVEGSKSVTSIKIRDNHGGDCEWDVRKNGSKYSCQLESEVSTKKVAEYLNHYASAEELFSKVQRQWVESYLERGVAWRSLEPAGPSAQDKWKVESEVDWTLERLTFQGTGLHEVSLRVPAKNAVSTYRVLTQVLAARGLGLCRYQGSKANWVLRTEK